MNLSLNIIRDYLPAEYQSDWIGESVTRQSLKRPLLYTGQDPMLPDHFYVVRTDFLPPAQEIQCQSLLCVGKGSTTSVTDANCSGILIRNTTDYIRVFNDVCKIFDYFDSWENEMRDELERETEFDYHQIAIIGARVLDNTIGMSDQFLHVLFTTDVDINGNIRIIEGKYDNMLLEIDDQIASVCLQEKRLHTPYLSSFKITGSATPYCYNIFPIDHFAGCCFIHPDHHPFQESDYEIADTFFHYFEKAFIKYIRNFSEQENPSLKAMNALLKGLPLSRQEQKMFLLSENESWILFRLSSRTGAKSMPQNYMHATICSLMPRTAFAALDGDIVTGIIKIQNNIPLMENTNISSFRNILVHMGYIAGISNEFQDLSSIGEYRFQAEYALRFSRRIANSKDLCFFNDCVLDYMLTACCTNLSLESLFSKQFKNLINYDKTHASSYVKTLECYLHNEGNIASTARELYLHRSSLLKRLERIKTILECDFTNPNLNLYYRICLELLHRIPLDK